jgi:hypothetical protein
MAEQSPAIFTAIIAGVAALAGSIGGPYLKGDADQRVAQTTAAGSLNLAQQKFYSDLVMKAIEPNEPEKRLRNLVLLAGTGLIVDKDVRDAIRDFATKNEKTPELIGQSARTNLATPPPVVQNARLFLLAGSVQKATRFEGLQREFGDAAYRVLGAKTLTDPGRPDRAEIRYFNAQDEAGAIQLRDFMRERLGDPAIMAKQYQDGSAGPGYMEVWLGR